MSPRESNPDPLICRVRGSEAISQASDAARAFGSALRLADGDLARLCIVIEELVANLYDHASLTEQDVVELSFASDPEGIRMAVVDPGNPFDPWAAPRKSGRAGRGGGVGIDIVRAWAKFVSYRASPEGNRLEFLLPIDWNS
jgi:anti-sigma regulatory factor (Ser/Thr protein kinase)